MRVALVSRELAPFHGGGVGTYAATLAPALAELGHEVHLITENRLRHDPAVVRRGGLTIHRVAVTPSPMHWMRSVSQFSAAACRLVLELHARHGLDAVEYPDTEGAGAALVLCGSGLGGRGAGSRPAVVVSIHASSRAMALTGSIEMHDACARAALFAMEHAAVRLAEVVTTPSEVYGRWAARLYGLAERPTLVRNPVERVRPLPPSGERVVLYVGRLEPGKGVEELALAWVSCGLVERGWRLRLVGADTRTALAGGSMGRRLREMVAERSPRAAEAFEVVGPVPRGELCRELASASFLVLPSRWENFPYACAEGLSAGRPVIVSDGGGAQEMIPEELRGRLVTPAGDAGALARAMAALADSGDGAIAAAGARCASFIGAMCDRLEVARQRVGVYARARSLLLRRSGERDDASARAASMLDWWRAMESPEVMPEAPAMSGGAHADRSSGRRHGEHVRDLEAVR